MIYTIKLSLLLTFSRVFHLHRKLVYSVYILLGILSAYYFAIFIVKIRPCNPISSFWEGEIANCVNQGATQSVDAIISVISDLIILLLPIPAVWSLQMQIKKKLRVVGMLGTGGAAIGFSIYRLVVVTRQGNAADQTLVFTKVALTW